MKSLQLLLLTLCICSINATAQDDLFGTEKKAPKKGFIISAHANLDIPAADMATRFGVNYRLGPALLYKTSSNWLFGANFDFILGNKINEPGFLGNVSPDGSFSALDQNGTRKRLGVFERGYAVGLQAGKIFNHILSRSPDNGLLLLTTVGFIQHKILIFDKFNEVPQFRGDYKKGYDRLTNGLFVEQFVGYNYLGSQGFLNFNIGFNALAGFTQGRRDFLFDVVKPGTDKRFDVLLGIKGSWYIPLFKRKSEELFFE